MSSAPSAGPADRYGGQPGPSRALVAAGVLLVAALVAWAVWVTVARDMPAATGQVTGFRVPGPHLINATLRVRAEPGLVRCALRALDSEHSVVGVTTARVRVGSSGEAVSTVAVRTTGTAVTAIVDGCTPGSD